ncbi:hypothetical protein J6O86_00965 [bacterium]|nr:hypothetical protein [bacterium]
MSIADKLKKTLSETNFFKKEEEPVGLAQVAQMEEPLDVDEKFEDLTEHVVPNIVSINPKVERVNKFEDLATQLVNKIKNTPYWAEFSMKSQEKMISKYFDKKVKTPKYVEIPYSLTDKLTFIEEVLKSVV